MKVVITVLAIVALFFIGYIALNTECARSHEEQYLEAPMTLNVGGGQYGGGIGIPIGNIEYKTRTVCDEYKRRD